MASVRDKVAAFNVVGTIYCPMNRRLGKVHHFKYNQIIECASCSKMCVFADHKVINKPPEVQTDNNVHNKDIWSHIISVLQTQVKIKRRRKHLKYHDNCFLGSDAVDVIQAYLVRSKSLGDAEVCRTKVARVCQVLLDYNVFEAVGSKSLGKAGKPGGFEDSSTSLYRFLNTERPSVDVFESVLLSPTEENSLNVTPCRWFRSCI